ncbi:MAG: hypothetical protein ABR920_13810 [Terriglobales bacterium]|jgi:hypothetical protein
MSTFFERYNFGTAAEKTVFGDLEDRGWTVEPGPRHYFSPGLNQVLNDWEDCHSAPCYLRWSPDWIVWRPDSSVPSKNLFAVDVKSGGYNIERRALLTYQDCWATKLNIPVIVVFEVNGNRLASSPGKLALNTLPRLGSDAGSGTPYYAIDPSKLSPLERWFGAKKP